MRHKVGLGMGRGLTAVTVAASMLAVAGPAEAAATATLHVSAAVTPATARVGSVATVSGTVSSHKAAVPLVLQRLAAKHWVSIGHANTAAGGRYSFNVRAPKKAATWVLRVTRTATVSSTVHLRVVTKGFAVPASAPPSVAVGVPLVVTGAVTPKATGSVWLQSLQGTTWHNLSSAKLTKSSTFSLPQSLPAGSYRLRVLKTFSTTVAEGHSATLPVTVNAAAPPGPTPPAALAVATTTLPSATMGIAYTATLAASGGLAPYTWGTAAALPAGISLSGAGIISGFPTVTSSSVVNVVVVDAAGASATRTLVLTVGASPAAGRTIRAWGQNLQGALGDGTNTASNTPVQVQNLTGVVAVAGSNGFGLGLRNDGTVWAWGINTYGQLGDGTTTNSSVPVQVVGVSGITAIATTNFGGYGVRYDGTVWAWGVGIQGQLGNGTLATTSTAVQVTGLTGAIAVAGGGATGYALLANGTVWAWGEGSAGDLGDGRGVRSTSPVQVSQLSGITAIAAGSDSGYALRSDGTVWAWGPNNFGQLGDGSLMTQLSPVQVSGLTGVKAITGNLWNGYALLSNGQVWSWGRNETGELGDGTLNAQSSIPVRVQGLTGMTAISAGALSGYALQSNGTVSAWGYNANGQLGNGNFSNSNQPVPVNGLTGVVSLGGGAIAYSAYAVL